MKSSILHTRLSFVVVPVADVDENDGRIQVETCNVKTTASFLKFKIVSAYNDFVSVHKVSVEGRSDVGA